MYIINPGQDKFEMVAYGDFFGRFYKLGFASLRLAQPRKSEITLDLGFTSLWLAQPRGINISLSGSIINKEK